jgi:plastocyanin
MPMIKTNNQNGFAHIIIVVVVLMVAAIGFIGYRILGIQDTKDSENSTTELIESTEEAAKNGNSSSDNKETASDETSTSNPTNSESSEDSSSNTTTTAPSTGSDGGSSGDSSGGTSSGGSGGGSSGEDETPAPQTKSFTIDSFSFGYSLSTLNVSPGDVVTINLTNSGGKHDWVVGEISGARTAIINGGQSDSITFTVPQSAAGKTYKFYCSVGNHRALGMEGNFVVSS